jgi:hypothetical protein
LKGRGAYLDDGREEFEVEILLFLRALRMAKWDVQVIEILIVRQRSYRTRSVVRASVALART